MSAPGLVAGAASYTNGLVAQRSLSACPTAFSRSPCPGTGVILRRPVLVARAPRPFSCRYTSLTDVADLGDLCHLRRMLTASAPPSACSAASPVCEAQTRPDARPRPSDDTLTAISWTSRRTKRESARPVVATGARGNCPYTSGRICKWSLNSAGRRTWAQPGDSQRETPATSREGDVPLASGPRAEMPMTGAKGRGTCQVARHRRSK